MKAGINVDPTNPAGAPDPKTLRDLGFFWVRLVSRPEAEMYALSCKNAGVRVLAVIARESDGYVLKFADVIQIGNEMDQEGESSWTMTPQQYHSLYYDVARRDMWKRPIILGGFCSGDVEKAVPYTYVSAYHGIAVHPYGKSTDKARELLRAYRARLGKPIWVTEWNRPDWEIGPFTQMLREEVDAGFWFCWSNGMVNPFGLEGKEDKMADANFRFVLGFKALADMIPDIVGEPAENEHHSAENGDGLQLTTRGLMVWRKSDNWTAFTDGYRTWINGPRGLENRLNGDRFEWEQEVPSPIFEQWTSPNCWPGRPYGPPIAIVLHTEGGSEAGAEATFMNPAAQVSAHYGVNLAVGDDVDVFVKLENRAWHAGILETGHRWFEVYTGTRNGITENPNHWTVGVETEDHGNPAQEVTLHQYADTRAVCRMAMNKYPTIKYLMTHRSISPRSRPNCPGNRWTASGKFEQLARELELIPIL